MSAVDGSETSITVRPGRAAADRARRAPAAEAAARESARSSFTNERASAPAPSRARTPTSRRSPSPTTRPPQAAATSATENDATPGLLLGSGGRCGLGSGGRCGLGGGGRGGLRRGRCSRSRDHRVELCDDGFSQVDGLVIGEEQPRVELVEHEGVTLLARDLVDHGHDPLLEISELLALGLFQLALGVVLEALQVERLGLIVLLELFHDVLGQGLSLVLDLLLHVPELLLALGELVLLDAGQALLADGGLLNDLLDLDHADLSTGNDRCLGGGAGALALGVLAAGASAQTPVVDGGQIGVIEVQKIVQESAVGKESLARVQKVQLAKQDDLAKRQKELRDMEQKIQDQGKALSEDVMEKLQKDYQAKALDLKRFQDDAQRELEESQRKELGDLEKRIMPVINEVAREQGYSLVFNKFNSGLLFADDKSVDLTEAVITKFNSMIAAPAAPAAAKPAAPAAAKPAAPAAPKSAAPAAPKK